MTSCTLLIMYYVVDENNNQIELETALDAILDSNELRLGNGLTLKGVTANRMIVGDSKVLGAPITLTWEEGMDSVESWGLFESNHNPLPSIEVGEVNICRVTAPSDMNPIHYLILPTQGTYYWDWEAGSSPVPVTLRFLKVTSTKDEETGYLTGVSLSISDPVAGGTKMRVNSSDDVYVVYYRHSR